MSEKTTDAKKTQKKQKAVKILKLIGFILLCCVFVALLVNSMLCIFAKHYYPTFGKSRLFAIVSDSMEPEIPTGHMIVCRVPQGEDDIQVGTVVTYEFKQGDSIKLITHRVTEVHTNAVTGTISYTTKGDNAPMADSYRPAYSDVVGIYTGKSCAVLGYVVGFLQSTQGAVALIIITLIFVFAIIMISYINYVQVWRNSALSALGKIRRVLSESQIEELKTIADVVGIMTTTPEDKHEMARKDKKLEWFLITGSLPKRPYRDDLFPTDAMSENVENKIRGLRYSEETEEENAENAGELPEAQTEGAENAEENPAPEGEGVEEPAEAPEGEEGAKPNPEETESEEGEPDDTDGLDESSDDDTPKE